MKILRALQVIGLIMLIAGMLFLGCFRCTSTKQVEKTETKTVIDSAYKERFDSLSVKFTMMQTMYEKQLRESRNTRVEFEKPAPCPDVVIPESCPRDSLTKILNQYRELARSFKNKVTQLADGRTEYEGQIASVSSDMEKVQREYERLQELHSALWQMKYDAETELYKVQEELSKYKNVKRSILSQWWLFPAGMLFMAGIFYRKRIKKAFVGASVLAVLLSGCYVYKYECPCCKKPPEWPQKPIIWHPEPRSVLPGIALDTFFVDSGYFNLKPFRWYGDSVFLPVWRNHTTAYYPVATGPDTVFAYYPMWKSTDSTATRPKE